MKVRTVGLLLAAVLVTAPALPQSAGREEVRVAPVRLVGVLAGAPYEIRVPARWNGTLVLYAHGLRAVGGARTVSAFVHDTVEEVMLDHGYAIAGSAYRSNGWAVGEAIGDTRRLAAHFRATVGPPRRTLLAGFSMGALVGLIDAGRYDAVLAACPVTSSTATFDRMLRVALAYRAVLGWPASWGTPANLRDDLDFARDVEPELARQLRAPGAAARFELVRRMAGIPPGPEWPTRVLRLATEARAEAERRAGGSLAPGAPARAWAAQLDPPTRLDRPVLALTTRQDALIPTAGVTAYAARLGPTRHQLTTLSTPGRGHCAFTPTDLVTAITRL